MSAGDAPSGVKFSYRHKRLRLVLRLSLWLRVLIVLIWTGATGVLLVDRVNPRLLDLGFTQWLSGMQLAGILAAGAIICLNFLLLKTVVQISAKTLEVVHLPWHIPSGVKLATRNILYAEIDTKETVRRDRYGNEYSTYRFTVQLSLGNAPPVAVYVTRAEAQAVFLRKILQAYLDGLKRESADQPGRSRL